MARKISEVMSRRRESIVGLGLVPWPAWYQVESARLEGAARGRAELCEGKGDSFWASVSTARTRPQRPWTTCP